jgi:hypothetical protein
MARDEAFATPQIGDVPLGRGEHCDMVGNPFFQNTDPLVVIGSGINFSLHRLQALGKKINPAANTNESAHKSDKQNERI